MNAGGGGQEPQRLTPDWRLGPLRVPQGGPSPGASGVPCAQPDAGLSSSEGSALQDKHPPWDFTPSSIPESQAF